MDIHDEIHDLNAEQEKIQEELGLLSKEIQELIQGKPKKTEAMESELPRSKRSKSEIEKRMKELAKRAKEISRKLADFRNLQRSI